MRVVRPWPRLPTAAGAAPSLVVPKARLDGIWVAWAGGKGHCKACEWVGFKVPSSSNRSVVLKFTAALSKQLVKLPAKKCYWQMDLFFVS